MKNNIVTKLIAALAIIGFSTGPFVQPAHAAGGKIIDKTRFVADCGIAYFCFHHWVWNPYKQGKFSAGAPHRTGTIVKASVALLAAVHFVKAASKIAHTSRDPLLQKLGGALDNMGGSFASFGQKFHSGQLGGGDIKSLGSSFGGFDGMAKAGGLNIQDKTPPIPIPGLG